MAANPFDQFDAAPAPAAAAGAANPFDRFDAAPQKGSGDWIGLAGRAALQGIDDTAAFAKDVAHRVGFGGALDLGEALAGGITGRPIDKAPTADQAADRLHLPTPVTPGEKMFGGGVRGAMQVALTGGAGEGVGLKAVAKVLGRDVLGGAAAGVTQEAAKEAGAPQPVQTAAGLVAGLLTPAATERVTARFGPKAAEVVAKVPEAAAVTPKGALTDEGRELAAQNGLHPQQLADAYEEAAKPEPAPEPVTPPQPGEAAVWKSAEADHPVQIVGAPIETADGRSYTPVASADGSQTHVPTEELHPAPDQTAPQAAAAAPEGAPEAVSAAPEPPTSEAVAARYARAQSEDVPLSQGQATQDFGAQAREDRLKGESSDAGIAARQFFNDQQTKIQGALDRFKSAFGPDATAEERGGIVQDAVRSLRDAGKAGVSALYQQARNLGDALGEGSGNLLHLDTAPLLQRLREIFIDEGVDPTVRNALKQQAAKYGLIGESPRTVEGETTVTLRDSSGEPAGKIAFTGAPERLTILNAEDLRKKINALYAKDTTHAAQTLKPLIDDAVSKALERAATEGTGQFGETMKAARAAHVEQQQTFKNNDIVQQLASWKKGSTDPAIQPEAVVGKIFGSGPDAVTNLKKVKAVLLNKPTDNSRAAWRAIQAHGVAKIFDQAMVLNSNPGEGLLGTVSGAKLNTAIAKFGADKLKVLLEPKDFDQLMKLRRIVGDATIPVNRTTNPSGTAGAIFRFLADKGMRFAGHIPVIGPVVHGVAYAGSVGKESLEAERTLKGITSFTPQTAAPKGEQHIRDLMQAANANTALGPLLAASANENQP